MGSRGDCWDNAVAATFFATLKKELVHRRSWPTRRELTFEVFEYIEGFYNLRRRHSTLGMHSPADYEKITNTNDKDQARHSSAKRSTEAGEDQVAQLTVPDLADLCELRGEMD
jgi:hypothetical protein